MPGPIAVKLRNLREERGLTRKEAAELARAYGVPVEELVEEE